MQDLLGDAIPTPKKRFTVAEAAQELGVQADWVRRLIHAGRLRAHKRGGRAWQISRNAIERFKLSMHPAQPVLVLPRRRARLALTTRGGVWLF